MTQKKLWKAAAALLLLCVAVGFAACATSGMTHEEKVAERQRVAQFVADAVANRDFKIEVDRVTPQRMSPRILSYGYGVTVKGDSIDSYLPFFGRVYRAEFGEQNGLRFEDRIAQWQAGQTKKDRYVVELLVRRHMEILYYQFDIFDNGKVSLMVRSDNRDTMYFTGEMVTE
ncbi:MAG: DUF4251 domain-containing protein [Prevotella sp.]|nr:DUF4251 domain-containing protein [Prevotella sp.]MBR5036486.1 DUF4251 domain-containing protein [Prevotella sp.]